MIKNRKKINLVLTHIGGDKINLINLSLLMIKQNK
jgi:hypothetical protein